MNPYGTGTNRFDGVLPVTILDLLGRRAKSWKVGNFMMDSLILVLNRAVIEAFDARIIAVVE